MMLVLDVDAERARAGLVRSGRVTWRTRGPRDLSGALGELWPLMDGARPAAVVLALEGDGRRPTWSGMRAMVALGNAMAFAWGVPAVSAAVPPDADDRTVVRAAKDAAEGAPRDARVRAVYDGLPNITVPRAS